MKQHILHIANSYGGTEVYKNLICELDQFPITQTVFVPLNNRNHSRIGCQSIKFKNIGSSIFYSTKLKWYHKYLYRLRILKITKEIIKHVDLSTITVIHAGTLCLDGAVAYEISKRYKIPYISAVRNTDVNLYFKKMKWMHWYFKIILDNATNIIFISPQYKDSFLKTVIDKKSASKIQDKVFVIPNGIDSLFLKQNEHSTKVLSKVIRLIFVASFQKGKGLIEIIYAIDVLRKKGYNVEFTAVGKGLPGRHEEKSYVHLVEDVAKDRDWVTLLGYKSKVELINLFLKNDIFVMPSSPETFGLVYAEALSQGLPVIYAKHQGFDGFFPEGKIGYSVIPTDSQDIASKIEAIIINYDKLQQNMSDFDFNSKFNWAEIVKTYITIYHKCK